MIDIMDITPGESYGCKFRVRNIALDEWDRPGGLNSLADVPIKRFGDYEGFGFLKQRDVEAELVIVVDEATDQEFVCGFDDIWDVDTVVFADEQFLQGWQSYCISISMNKKPPHYTVDKQTKQFLELVALWAHQLSTVQQHRNSDMVTVIDAVCERFALEPYGDDEPASTSADVVQLRPFRVIKSNKSETENEPG